MRDKSENETNGEIELQLCSLSCRVGLKLSLIWLSRSDAQTPCHRLQTHSLIPFACAVHYVKVGRNLCLNIPGC